LSRPALFQSNKAAAKVRTMPPRNNPQKVRLCELPRSGVGPDAERRCEQSAQQEKIEHGAGGKTCCEDETGEDEIDHGARARKQIPANNRAS
jgi:hypothetical protein